jgi:ribosome biogenesis protein ERB1
MDPSERPYNFIPKKHTCLRHVAAYPNAVKERFERCLDLYLCPRQLKKRLNIDPESLIPRLPRPRELKPFPNSLCLQYIGHTKAVRSISLSPDGQYLVSGSDDGTVMMWEVDCCLCRRVWSFDGVPVTSVSWNPNPSHHVIAAAVGRKVVFISTGTGDLDATEVTDSLLEAALAVAASSTQKETKGTVIDEDSDDSSEQGDEKSKKSKEFQWSICSSSVVTRNGKIVGPRVDLTCSHPITHLAWHHKGDYFGVLCSSNSSNAVSIHQVFSFHLYYN